MARLSRIVVPGYPHHVTQHGVLSMAVFHEESDCRKYLGMLGEEIARHGVPVLVWCLMTNHVHFVAVPHRSDDGPLSTLRKLTRTGLPAGDAPFVSRIETITGRDLSKGKPGRPRKRTA